MTGAAMSNGWHWFVILGTGLSLAFTLWLLLANRKTSEKETTGHEWDGIQELDTPLPMWWVWMFIGTIVFALVYLAYYPGLGNYTGVNGWTSSKQHDEEVASHDARFAPLYAQLAAETPEEFVKNRTSMQVGRRLFINHCSTCHGVSAKGAFGFPDLTDQEWIWGGSFEHIKQTITGGRQAQMPAWGVPLGEDGVNEVAHYVLQISGQEHDVDLSASGKERFGMFCVACHNADGKGNTLLGAPDLTNDSWLYGGDVNQIAFTIREGRQGQMPAQTGNLSDEKIRILANYVWSLE